MYINDFSKHPIYFRKHKNDELVKLHNKAKKVKTKIGKTGRGEKRDKLIK